MLVFKEEGALSIRVAPTKNDPPLSSDDAKTWEASDQQLDTPRREYPGSRVEERDITQENPDQTATPSTERTRLPLGVRIKGSVYIMGLNSYGRIFAARVSTDSIREGWLPSLLL